jgi:hypothetical protein
VAQVVEAIDSQLDEAEEKAWKALSGYKFMMFGYWSAIWVHLNKLNGGTRRNPFAPLVILAQEHQEENHGTTGPGR